MLLLDHCASFVRLKERNHLSRCPQMSGNVVVSDNKLIIISITFYYVFSVCFDNNYYAVFKIINRLAWSLL